MENLNEVLVQLATKFDTTVDHLWQVMINQARLASIIDFGVIVFLVAFLVAGFLLVWKYAHFSADGSDPVWDCDAASLAWTIYLIVFLVVGAILFCSIEGVVTETFNPEYWALMKILGR